MKRSPKYLAVATTVEALIRRGTFAPGEALPSEKKLAAELGVNHLTLRKALKHLAGRGVVHTLPSKGNFVGPLPPKEHPRTGLVGILLPTPSEDCFTVLCRLEELVGRDGCAPVVRFARGSVVLEREILRSFAALRVDGIVAAPSPGCLPDYAAIGTPTIFLSAAPGHTTIPCVYADDVRGARDAVEHLLDLGHTRIAYVGARGDMTSRLRFTGYSEAMERAKVPILPKYIRQRESTRDWGFYAAQGLFTDDDPPTAVFCGSDALATGVLRYLGSTGLRVPESVSVVGFGDSEACRDLRLSTVSRPLASVAEEAWHNLKLGMDGQPVPKESRLAATFVLRKSTAPPPGRRHAAPAKRTGA